MEDNDPITMYCYNCSEFNWDSKFCKRLNKEVDFGSTCINFKEKSNLTQEQFIQEYNIKLKRKEIDVNIPKIASEVLQLMAMGKNKEATELIVDFIISKERINTIRDDVTSEVYIYIKDGKYKGIRLPQGRTYIKEYVRKILGKAYTTHTCKQVLDKIEVDTYTDQKDFFNKRNLKLKAFQNCILNLETREVLDFSPEYVFFSKSPVSYVKGKDCPNIKKFFKSLFKDEREILVIQEIFGFCLWGEYFLEKAFMFLGGGRNGKGKTLTLLKLFLGVENCAEISLEDLENDGFAISELFNKDANLCGDLSKTALRNTGIFKKLTARDLISAQRKFLTRVHFVNNAKMIFSANELPITIDLTEAFFNRWIIIEFLFTFLPQTEINQLKESDKINVKLQDPNIIENIISDDELSGLLNWALDGLDRLRKNKSFSYSPSTNETKTKWLRKSDSCMAFIMDCIESDYENYIIKSDFKRKYAQYCYKHKLPISSDKKILQILSQIGVVDDRKSLEGSQKAVWGGLRFKESETQNVIEEEVESNAN